MTAGITTNSGARTAAAWTIGGRMTDDDTTPVATAADIRDAHADIDGRAVAVIRQHLTDGDLPVIWMAEWLWEQKALDPVEGCPQVTVGVIDAETEKAWQIDQPGTDAEPVWVPKSQSRVFALADGVGKVESDQRTLGEL